MNGSGFAQMNVTPLLTLGELGLERRATVEDAGNALARIAEAQVVRWVQFPAGVGWLFQMDITDAGKPPVLFPGGFVAVVDDDEFAVGITLAHEAPQRLGKEITPIPRCEDAGHQRRVAIH